MLCCCQHQSRDCLLIVLRMFLITHFISSSALLYWPLYWFWTYHWFGNILFLFIFSEDMQKCSASSESGETCVSSESSKSSLWGGATFISDRIALKIFSFKATPDPSYNLRCHHVTFQFRSHLEQSTGHHLITKKSLNLNLTCLPPPCVSSKQSSPSLANFESTSLFDK